MPEMKLVNRGGDNPEKHQISVSFEKGTAEYDMLDKLTRAGVSASASMKDDVGKLVKKLFDLASKEGMVK